MHRIDIELLMLVFQNFVALDATKMSCIIFIQTSKIIITSVPYNVVGVGRGFLAQQTVN